MKKIDIYEPYVNFRCQKLRASMRKMAQSDWSRCSPNWLSNLLWFDLYSVILFCCFYGGNRGKTTGKIHFLRVRSASLVDSRMRICYQNNDGSNISKRENSKLWRDYFRNCAPVSLGEQRILIK